MRKQIGQGQRKSLGLSQWRGMKILNVPHHWSLTSRTSWVGKSPPWWAPRQKADCHPCQCQCLKIQNPLHQNKSDWILWHAKHVSMPPWWKELMKIPSHDDYQKIAQKVHTSFEVPRVYNWAKGVDNDQIPPPPHLSPGKYHFMLPSDVRFGSQDYKLTQLHHTLTYARAIQYWAEKAQLLIPGQPCYLVESMIELWWAVELLVSFMKVGVFTAAAPSNWMEVSSPRLMDPIP